MRKNYPRYVHNNLSQSKPSLNLVFSDHSLIKRMIMSFSAAYTVVNSIHIGSIELICN